MERNNPQLVTDTNNRLIVNGPSVRVEILEPDQITRIYFDATANQRLGLGISDVHFAQNPSSFVVEMFAPDGAFLNTTACGAEGADLELILPETDGLYAITVGGPRTTTGSLVLTLSENVSRTIGIDGTATVSLSRPGQNAEIIFDGRVDQWLGIGSSNVRVDSGEGPGFVIDVYGPDHHSLLLNTFVVGRNSDEWDDFHFGPLPRSGACTIFVDAVRTSTGALTLTLFEDLASAVQLGGPPISLSLRRGQNARVFFHVAAGQTVLVHVYDVKRVGISAMGAYIIAPNGSIVTERVFPLPRPLNPRDPPDRDDFSIEPWPVPLDGDYTLLFEAPRQVCVSFKVTLT